MNDTTTRIISLLDKDNAEFFVYLFGADFAESRYEGFEDALHSAILGLCDDELLASAECNDELLDKIDNLHAVLVALQYADV